MPEDRPVVTDADVRRVIDRDFPPNVRSLVYSRLLTYADDPLLGAADRVRLAILKLANGDLYEIDRQLDVALHDPRDVFAAAEEPRFDRIGFVGAKKLTPAALEQLQQEDLADYKNWLNKE